METYIIVRVKTKENSQLTDRQFKSRMGYVRKAIHAASEDLDVHVADMVACTNSYMTKEDSKEIANIFTRSLNRAKYNYEFFKEHGFFPPRWK